MKLSRKLSDALNFQINEEMWSANLYLSMAIYFDRNNLPGCAHWMKKQSQEEMEHAYMMIDWSVQRGGNTELKQVNVVPTGWGTVNEVFEHVYEHEVRVSAAIDKILEMAVEEKDTATQDFMWTFVREQVEEEDTAQKVLDRLKLFGEKNLALLDIELGKR